MVKKNILGKYHPAFPKNPEMCFLEHAVYNIHIEE